MTTPARHLPVLHASPASGLADGFSRRVTYLRVSVTDRCNYRCTYCMPAEGVDVVARDEVLTFEEIERIVTVFAGLGVRRVRLTGGEPTVRKDLVRLVARLARVPGIAEVVLTTNGHVLAELAAPLAAAGLTGLNVSLDTLDADKFRAITRRGELGRVIAGVDAARAAGLPVKLNVVALKGFNDTEVGALCDWAWTRRVTPRFIEWMPMSDGALFAPGSVLTAAEIRARVEAHAGAALVPAAASGDPAGPARYWEVLAVDGNPRRVGIISALSEHFCDTCNRVRLTATGQLHTCLAYDDATDLRALVRGGADDEAVVDAVRAAVGVKRQGHEFTLGGCGAPRKHMVAIGG